MNREAFLVYSENPNKEQFSGVLRVFAICETLETAERLKRCFDYQNGPVYIKPIQLLVSQPGKLLFLKLADLPFSKPIPPTDYDIQEAKINANWESIQKKLTSEEIDTLQEMKNRSILFNP